MWNELRGSTDTEAFDFLATQLIHEADKNGKCVFWPRWTKQYRGKLPDITQFALASVLFDYPKLRWPMCQFVGSFGDVQIWLNLHWVKRELNSYGFFNDVYGNIFGVNCQ